MTRHMAPAAGVWKGAWFLSIASSAVFMFWYLHSWRKNIGDEAGSDVDDAAADAFKKRQCTSDSVKLPPHIEREIQKEQRRKAKVPMLARKTPMYDNVRMLDPSGQVLCTISTKKGKWYVGKRLAEWTDESQSFIKLKFEPKGRSNQGEEGRYVRSSKQNVCVACGEASFYMRHYVVPYVYRSLLPLKFKSHLSHDIVILCPKCHLHCEQETQRRMHHIDELLRKHVDENTRSPFITDPHLYNVRSCALALLRWKHKIPAPKIAAYEETVRAHLSLKDNDELTTDLLQSAIDGEYRIPNPDYVSGAELVVRSFDQDEAKIAQFIRDWRRHFVVTLHPRFLPEGWSIDNPVTSNL